MQHYAVVFFPEGSLSEIQSFRNTYDPKAQVLNPHVTLVFPFNNFSKEETITHLTKVASRTKSFAVTLQGLFTSFDKYLFLLVSSGKEEVISLHDSLYSGIFSPLLRSDIPFVPHMTLGSFMKENNFDENLHAQAMQEAEELHLSFHCNLDKFSLIQGDGIQPAEIIQTFSLQK